LLEGHAGGLGERLLREPAHLAQQADARAHGHVDGIG
jgi:hypothetical protein